MSSLRALAGAVFLLTASISAWWPSAASAAQGKGCLPLTGPAYTAVAYFQLLNAELAGLLSTNSGARAPGTCDNNPPVLGQHWLDTSTAVPWLRIWSGNKWLPMAALDVTNGIYEPPIGGGIATLASKSVTDLCATPESSISITGATTINSFGSSCAVGQVKLVAFAGVLILAHSPTGIVLPTGAPIATQVGDAVVVNYVGGGVWRAFGYSRADGTPLVPSHYAGQSITMRGTSCPAGSLPEDGRSVSKAVYPQLAASLGNAWGGTDTTLNLPDTRGNFERGWGDGQTVDSGRTFGGLQDWLVANHTHSVNIGVASNFSSSFSAAGATDVFNQSYFNNKGVTAGNNGNVNSGFGGAQIGVSVSGTVNGTAYGIVSGNTGGMNAGGGNENRPRNITAFHCIFTSTF